MTTDEKKLMQERLCVAEKLENRMRDAKNLLGMLTAQRDRRISITDKDSGQSLFTGGPEDLLAGMRLQVKALGAELERA